MRHSHIGVTSLQQDAAHANKVTLVGALFDALLGVVKIITGLLGHSAALVAAEQATANSVLSGKSRLA